MRQGALKCRYMPSLACGSVEEGSAHRPGMLTGVARIGHESGIAACQGQLFGGGVLMLHCSTP